MNYWILTDTHFGHAKMIEACSRPNDFEKKILDNVSFHCKPEDVLIHIGDFCIGDDEKWHKLFMSKCKCEKKWLVRGNHDRKSMSWYLKHGWDCVCEQLTLDVFGKKIIFSHKPLTIYTADMNIHGHHHNTRHHPEDEIASTNLLLYMEHEYKPFNLRKLVER